MSFKEPLTKEEENIVLQRYLSNNDQKAKEELIERNMRLLVNIAKEFSNNLHEIEDFEDLVSIGTYGLIDAINKYNIKKGKLTTFIGKCVRNKIMEHHRYMSRKKRGDANKIESLGKIVVDKYREMSLEEVLIDENSYLEPYIIQKEEFIMCLNYILNSLKIMEKVTLLKRAFGYKQDDIAEEIGATQGYVSQHISTARKKLKILMECNEKVNNPKYHIFEKNGRYKILLFNVSEEIVKHICKCSICEYGVIITLDTDISMFEKLAEIVICIENKEFESEKNNIEKRKKK